MRHRFAIRFYRRSLAWACPVQPTSDMPLIDGFMPSYSLHQVDHVAVTADPAATWLAVRAVDLYRIRWARALFELRTLPDRVMARLNAEPAPLEPTARIDDITGDTGFLVLGEEEGHEIVVGSVGKFWRPQIDFAKVTSESFAAFDTPGFGKLAWCLRVDPRESGGSWITFDLRVGGERPRDRSAYAVLRRSGPCWRGARSARG
jgi:hypothetical protein